MKNTRTLTAGLGLWFCLASASAFAQGVTTFSQGGAPQKCDSVDIANGPFDYSTPGITQTTFNGKNGSPISTSFTIKAPSVDPKKDSAEIDVFPGEGQTGDCSPTAFATISALEIAKVGDATGSPLVEPVPPVPYLVRQAIAAAFAMSPSSYTFTVGEKITVSVVVSNPNLNDSDYGDYDIKLAAKAPGSGIGVGIGPHFFLSLRGVTNTDTTPPVVSVTKPSDDETLGVIGVEVTAFDPDTPPASGLASISASVSSAGGTVSELPITLAFNRSLPELAGVLVTGTGSFTPTGGAPGSVEGTTDAAAFTKDSRSGIGNYTIDAQASDVAGNLGDKSKSFNVKYDVAFTGQSVPPGCTARNLNPCKGQFKFTVRRSNVTSDGAFMFDHTVAVNLVRSNNTVAAMHVFGTGSINDVVQIDQTNLVYQTHFRHSDLTGNQGLTSYKLQVYFLDVDGNWVLQAESSPLAF